MPELPEVEHVKRGIEPYILNATIKSVTFQTKLLRANNKEKRQLLKELIWMVSD